MRLVFVLLFGCACSMLVSGIEHDSQYYSETFENVNVGKILTSERLFRQYMNCILDQGTCNAEGHALKRILPEAITTVCKKCNPEQRETAKQLGNFLRYNKPEDWTLLQQKFDPYGQQFAAFEQFLDS